MLSAAMENASSPSDVWNNVTTSKDGIRTTYFTDIHYTTVKVMYAVIGTVGVVDNLFVIFVFFLFIKITDKVSATLNIPF